MIPKKQKSKTVNVFCQRQLFFDKTKGGCSKIRTAPFSSSLFKTIFCIRIRYKNLQEGLVVYPHS